MSFSWFVTLVADEHVALGLQPSAFLVVPALGVDLLCEEGAAFYAVYNGLPSGMTAMNCCAVSLTPFHGCTPFLISSMSLFSG